jgi:hypothetical protein
MSLVSVKMVENRIAPVPSTNITRQHRFNAAWYTRIWNSDVKESNISGHEAASSERYACQRMMECYRMRENVKFMSERFGVSEGFHCMISMMRKQKMKQKTKEKWVRSRIHENLLADINSANWCMCTHMRMSRNFGDHLHEIASQPQGQLYVCIEDLPVNDHMKQCQNIHIVCKNCTNADKEAFSSHLNSFIHNCYIFVLWHCYIVTLLH